MFLIAVYGLDRRTPFFQGLRTTKAQTSLHTHAVWSAPLSFAFWKVSYQNLRFVQPSVKYVDG